MAVPPPPGIPPVQPPSYPYPPPSYPARPPTNGMAIASMVFSLVGIVICGTSIIGIILGHVALKQIERTGEEGRAFAIVGLVVGYVTLALTIIFVAFYVIFILIAASGGY